MLSQRILVLIFFSILTIACGKNKDKSKELIRANEIHLASMQIHENIEEDLEAKKQEATKNKDSVSIYKLDSLGKILELWEEGVVEVPGFEHEHHHEKGELHEHKTGVQMTDESMLEYQKSSKQAIEELQKEIKSKF